MIHDCCDIINTLTSMIYWSTYVKINLNMSLKKMKDIHLLKLNLRTGNQNVSLDKTLNCMNYF